MYLIGTYPGMAFVESKPLFVAIREDGFLRKPRAVLITFGRQLGSIYPTRFIQFDANAWQLVTEYQAQKFADSDFW